jgi:hypothetical protein
VSLQVSAIMLGVKDVDRAMRFHAEGLGCEVEGRHRRLTTDFRDTVSEVLTCFGAVVSSDLNVLTSM